MMNAHDSVAYAYAIFAARTAAALAGALQGHLGHSLEAQAAIHNGFTELQRALEGKAAEEATLTELGNLLKR